MEATDLPRLEFGQCVVNTLINIKGVNVRNVEDHPAIISCVLDRNRHFLSAIDTKYIDSSMVSLQGKLLIIRGIEELESRPTTSLYVYRSQITIQLSI
jgi:hypothetical protein